MVPDSVGWKKASFRQILKLDRGSSPRPIVNYMTDRLDGVNWIKIGDTKNRDLYIDSTKERITPEGAKKSRKVSKGEIILSNSMSFGKPYILNIDGYIHDGWFVIRNYEEYLKKEFLIQILSSELIQRQYQRLAAGGVVSNISSDLVYAVKINLPPLPEQKKIAQILSTWDQAITATERLLENSQQRKKGLMQQLLTGKKRLPGFEGEFKAISLSAAATITMGTSPKSAAYNSIGDGLPLLQGNADIEGRRSKPRVFTSEITKVCQPGDILLSVRAPVGSVAISHHDACIGRGICAIKAKNKNNQEFLYQWMLWYEPRWASLSQGSTFESVNSSDIKNLEIKLPEPAEQQAISHVLSVADRESELLENRLDQLKQEKKALMQQLLTGKRRVQVDTEAA
jgi:type I restriction enzyme S subunit|tara:strand:+ start:7511 stop:8704 length:1194 start_codon:yes stop_codon:yes gene_type:complete